MQDNKGRGSATRRKFMRNTVLIASTAMMASNNNAEEAPAILQEDEPIALALGYKADGAAVDTAKYPKRQGPKGDEQFCSTCAPYSERGSSGYGSCSPDDLLHD